MKGVCVCLNICSCVFSHSDNPLKLLFHPVCLIFIFSHHLFLLICLRARDQLTDVIKAATKWVPYVWSSTFYIQKNWTVEDLCNLHFHTNVLACIILTVICTVWCSGTVLLFRETPSWLWAALLLPSPNMRATCLLIMTAASGYDTQQYNLRFTTAETMVWLLKLQ